MSDNEPYVKALEEVLHEAKRLLAVIEHYTADFPLDVHHSDVVALDSAIYRAERTAASGSTDAPKPPQ
jgi:hypothetical protein